MSNSVLQDWVMELQKREQGTLLTAVRGCDVAPKENHNLNSTERWLSAFVRWCFMNPADPREVDKADGCWFRSVPPPKFRPSALGHFPLHWYTHVMHALKIISVRHPNRIVAEQAKILYQSMVHSLHLEPESDEAMEQRLGEDRIASGKIVS